MKKLISIVLVVCLLLTCVGCMSSEEKETLKDMDRFFEYLVWLDRERYEVHVDESSLMFYNKVDVELTGENIKGYDYITFESNYKDLGDTAEFKTMLMHFDNKKVDGYIKNSYDIEELN